MTRLPSEITETMRKYSPSLIVAVSIYDHLIHDERVWFSKLCKVLPLEKHVISAALDELEDWGIVYREYGELEMNKAGSLLFIEPCHMFKVDEMYGDMIK